MNAKFLSGKTLANTIQEQLHQKIIARKNQNSRVPGLAVVVVGDDPASQIYVKHKRLACEKVGIRSVAYDLPIDTNEDILLELIDQLNQDAQIDGILVQLPLPSHINSNTVIERISPDKDVDGFHPYNLGRLAQSRPLFRPCTPYGIIQLLKHHHISLTGIHAVVIGASNIVGRPMALELLMAGSTVTICHSKTQQLSTHVQQADLIISAIGKRDVIASEWFKPGVIIVDVGIHRLSDGSVTGDIDFITAIPKASWITPVPGGVGPMTVAMLMVNTVAAAENTIGFLS